MLKQKLSRILARKWNKKEKIITAAVIAALAGSLAAALIYISHKDIVVIKEPVFFSYLGEEFDYQGKTTLKWDKNQMYMQNDTIDGSLAPGGTPLYMEDRESLIVTSMMSYTNPDTNYMRRLSYFGKVYYEKGMCLLSVDGRKKLEVNGGYLFDGNNTWIFLEPTTVTVGSQKIVLEPMSYITVKNKDYFYYYSAGDKKSVFTDWTGDDITATDEEATWTLNLSRDLLTTADGKIQMLIPNPEVLDVIQ